MERHMEQSVNAQTEAVLPVAKPAETANRVNPQQSCPSCAAASGNATVPTSWI